MPRTALDKKIENDRARRRDWKRWLDGSVQRQIIFLGYLHLGFVFYQLMDCKMSAIFAFVRACGQP